MIKEIVFSFIIALSISNFAQASINHVIDGSQNAAIYQTSKKTVYFNRVSVLNIAKTARPNGNDTMVLQIMYQGIGVAKAPVDNTAKVIIDGVYYPIQKIIKTNEYVIKPVQNKTFADFSVPSELMDKIANYKHYCWFEFNRVGKKPNVIKMSEKEQEEVRLISKLTYADYNDFIAGRIEAANVKSSIK